MSTVNLQSCVLRGLVLSGLIAAAGCGSGDGAPPDASVDGSSDVGVDAGGPQPRHVGPGLGAVTFDENELFTPVAFVDRATGVPRATSLLRVFKPFGTNSVYMVNGYLMVLFASDSGLPGGGLLFYDVSDPRAPVLVHTVYQQYADDRSGESFALEGRDGLTGRFREAHSIGFAEVDGRDLAMLHSAAGIEIWDVTDVRYAHPVGELALPGVNAGDYEDVAWQVVWQGRHAYVAAASRGIYIVDATDPARPVLAEREGPNPVPPNELGGFRVGPLFAFGNDLVVSSMENNAGFAVLDISNPTEPRVRSTLTEGLPLFYASCFGGDRLALSVRGARAPVLLYDTTDPFVITPLPVDVSVDDQLYCAFQDDSLFQGNQNDFAKFDLAAPGGTVEVGRGALGRASPDHGQVSVLGNLVYIGNDHGSGSAIFPHQAAPDTTPPTLRAVSPANGAVHQATTSRVGVVWSDAIDNTSVTPSSVVLREVGGAVVPAIVALQATMMNLEPRAPLERGATYELVFPAGGIRDYAGNPLAAEVRTTFTVSPIDPTGTEALAVTLDLPTSVAVGEQVTVRAVATGPGPVEFAYRFGDEPNFTSFSPAATAVHTYTTPGHRRVFVQATNGASRVVSSVSLTVHRPIVGPVAQSSTLALSDTTLFVANRDHGTVSRVDRATNALRDEILVGATPTSVAVGALGQAFVTVQGADRVVRIAPDGSTSATALRHGAAPCGVVSAGATFVSEYGTGDLVRLDDAGTETGRIHIERGICGLSLAPSGNILVSALRPSVQVPSGRLAAWVTEVDPLTFTVVRTLTLDTDSSTVDTEDRARGVPTFLGAPGVSPDGERAFVPAVQANIERGMALDGQRLDHESTVRAVVPQLDLATGRELPGERIDWNDRAGPMAAVTTPLGDRVFVSLMGSNSVGVFDAYTGAAVTELRDVGSAPRGLALSDDGTRLYVDLFLSRQVAVYDVSGLLPGGSSSVPTRVARVDVTTSEPLSDSVLLGKRIFYFAGDPRMSRDGYLACASCHLDGGHDGLTWDFTDRGEGLRNTPDLRGRAGLGHGALHWSANFDEVQDFEHDIRDSFGGAGFLDDSLLEVGSRNTPLGDPKAGLSPDLDALADYLASLSVMPRSPYRTALGGSTTLADEGAMLFDSLGCATCHAGAQATDSSLTITLHDVGTFGPYSGSRLGVPLTGLDTPTLRGLFDTAPYLHDGSAPDLRSVLTSSNTTEEHGMTAGLSSAQLDALVAFLLARE